MQNPLGEFSQSCPEVQAPRIGGKQQVESYCLRARASKLAFWVLGRDRVRKLLLLWTHEKRRQELPKYHQDLDQIVAAVHIQRSNKQTKTRKKQPSRAHPSMFFDVSKGCGKALPGKAFVRRMQNYCQVFFRLGVAFHGLKQKQQQTCTSICGRVSTVQQEIQTCCIETVLTKQSCPNAKQMLHGLLY